MKLGKTGKKILAALALVGGAIAIKGSSLSKGVFVEFDKVVGIGQQGLNTWIKVRFRIRNNSPYKLTASNIFTSIGIKSKNFTPLITTGVGSITVNPGQSGEHTVKITFTPAQIAPLFNNQAQVVTRYRVMSIPQTTTAYFDTKAMFQSIKSIAQSIYQVIVALSQNKDNKPDESEEDETELGIAKPVIL